MNEFCIERAGLSAARSWARWWHRCAGERSSPGWWMAWRAGFPRQSHARHVGAAGESLKLGRAAESVRTLQTRIFVSWAINRDSSVHYLIAALGGSLSSF